MVKVIPAILAKSKEKFLGKVSLIRDFAPELQIDVADGLFVANTTWADPEEVAKMALPPYEVHLMIRNPKASVSAWAKAGARRIIFHFEAAEDAMEVIREIKSLGCEAGIAINPETQVELTLDLLNELSVVLVMGVEPGWSGQEFKETTIQKVAGIRSANSRIAIEVDGGVSADNAQALGRAGATALVAASAIFSDPDPKSAYENILKKANE